jgi:predicted O-methyltransferase YrrM
MRSNSAAYIAGGLRRNGVGRLWTIEGTPALADIAEATFNGLGLDNIATAVFY